MRVPIDLVGCSKTVKLELEQSSLRGSQLGVLALVSKFLIGFFLSINLGTAQHQHCGRCNTNIALQFYSTIGEC